MVGSESQMRWGLFVEESRCCISLHAGELPGAAIVLELSGASLAIAAAFLVAAFFEMEHFADVSRSGEGLVEAVLDQRFHAEKPCLAADILCWLAVECHLANCGVHCHQFMNGDASSEAGVVAVIAATASHPGGICGHFVGDVEVLQFAF